MIITRLIGGLGNQLFQYAIGRHLAIRNNTELKLDLSAFQTYDRRKYLLSHFQIVECIATPSELRWINQALSVVDYFRYPIRSFSGSPRILKERAFEFQADVLSANGDLLLDGYWQSPDYFTDIETIIRQEFRLNMPIDGLNREMAQRISSANAISVHIRRGDYVSMPDAAAFHGVCSLTYYHTALQMMADTIPNPVFFVFSDEPEWVRENLKTKCEMHYVNHNSTDEPQEDLRLMTLCQHHIVANSSFSWWGAWLNLNPEKQVIAPDPWFANQSVNTSTLLPNGWKRIAA